MPERFYLPEQYQPGQLLELRGDEAHHLARVRRIEVGQLVELFDGLGHATAAQVIELDKHLVKLQPLGDPLPDRDPAAQITLATAVPKGDRFDWLVEKATELGVARLVPLITERSVVDPRDRKLERLSRAVIESSKQCGRNRLMTIDPVTPWPTFIMSLADPIRLIAHPGRRKFAAWPLPSPGGEASIAIGPEGGFTDAEIEAAAAAGWVSVSLGATLLRVETAGIAASARLLALAESAIEGEGWDA